MRIMHNYLPWASKSVYHIWDTETHLARDLTCKIFFKKQFLTPENTAKHLKGLHWLPETNNFPMNHVSPSQTGLITGTDGSELAFNETWTIKGPLYKTSHKTATRPRDLMFQVWFIFLIQPSQPKSIPGCFLLPSSAGWKNNYKPCAEQTIHSQLHMLSFTWIGMKYKLWKTH